MHSRQYGPVSHLRCTHTHRHTHTTWGVQRRKGQLRKRRTACTVPRRQRHQCSQSRGRSQGSGASRSTCSRCGSGTSAAAATRVLCLIHCTHSRSCTSCNPLRLIPARCHSSHGCTCRLQWWLSPQLSSHFLGTTYMRPYGPDHSRCCKTLCCTEWARASFHVAPRGSSDRVGSRYTGSYC